MTYIIIRGGYEYQQNIEVKYSPEQALEVAATEAKKLSHPIYRYTMEEYGLFTGENENGSFTTHHWDGAHGEFVKIERWD